MESLSVLIIGAGGVASYLAPVLTRLQIMEVNVTIMDGDTLEERNIDRQLFTNKWIGENKAKALANTYAFNYIPEFFNPNTTKLALDTRPDIIICLVDNRKSRVAIYEWAMENEINFITAANELFDASGDYVHPDWYKTPLCLLQRAPDLLSPVQGEGGISCTGVQGDKFPQLAIANHAAATMALSLLWTRVINQAGISEMAMEHVPYSIKRTLSSWETKCLH